MTAPDQPQSEPPQDAPYEGVTVDLLARIRDGDDAAWEALYNRYHDDLLFAVRAHLGPGMSARLESEDVLVDPEAANDDRTRRIADLQVATRLLPGCHRLARVPAWAAFIGTRTGQARAVRDLDKWIASHQGDE